MANEFTIFSRWLAYELRMQGFRFIRMEVNRNYPQFNVWVFEDSAELQMAIKQLTTNRQR